MKKIIYISLLTVLFSCTESEDTAVEQIKICCSDWLGEECLSKAYNQYCGVDFDPSTDKWWYEMKDWAAESQSNRDKINRLTERLREEIAYEHYDRLRDVADGYSKDILKPRRKKEAQEKSVTESID